MTELEPLLTKLRMMAQNHRDIGNYEMEQRLLDIVATIVGLESENASLRGAVEGFCDQNAKLRELVKSMYYDLTHMMFPPDWVKDYETDMRELGIEVEE